MAWISLFIAGLFETGWAIGLKASEGFTRLWPSVITIVAMIISIVLLAYSMKTIPVGTAYPVWTGIGAAGTAVIGMLVFGESRELVRIFFLLLILIGTLGLKATSGH